MTEYHNPKPREGINVSQEHPLKEFAQLLIGVALVVVVLVVAVSFMAATLASYIPFEYEQKMVSSFEFSQVEDSERQRYLQDLADKLAKEMNLSEEMHITVHYSNDETVNAFATLGGHLIFFKGLVDQMQSEQELAAVMGHEIAHIKHRHPIVALGKGVTVAALAGALTGFSGSSSGSWLIGSSANLSMLQYSRQQESRADTSSAMALVKVYGHIQGLQHLFVRFAELEGAKEGGPAMVELFRSHPYSENRWQSLLQQAKSQDWSIAGELTDIDWSNP